MYGAIGRSVRDGAVPAPMLPSVRRRLRRSDRAEERRARQLFAQALAAAGDAPWAPGRAVPSAEYIEVLEAAVDRSPDDPKSLARLAVALFEAGMQDVPDADEDFDNAEELLRDAIDDLRLRRCRPGPGRVRGCE
jgi:hypothetical protein